MSRRAPHSFYEFFAGGGMARLGLGEGWSCRFANDFDPVKAATYRANFADARAHFHEGDVWALTPADLPGTADLAWASSPCQDFSLAGGRAGLAGGRSSAFFGFWRLVEALAKEDRAPRFIVIENVSGLLTSHGGADFAALCQALADQGYRFGALEIDASAFTQSRPRVFIIATRSPTAGLEGPSPYHSPAVRLAQVALPEALQAMWLWWRLDTPARRNSNLAGLLEPDEAVAWRSADQTRDLLALMEPRHRARVDAAMASGARRAAGAVFRRTRKGVQRAEVRFDGVAGCLRTPRGGSSRQMLLIIDQGRVRSRLLTGREGARLMGLPDSYQLPATTTAALHVVGDGVAVPVVRHLAREILEGLVAGPRSAEAAA